MTKHEAAIVSAFTGVTIGKFAELHDYSELALKRQVMTYEFGSKEFAAKLKDAARADFISMTVK